MSHFDMADIGEVAVVKLFMPMSQPKQGCDMNVTPGTSSRAWARMNPT